MSEDGYYWLRTQEEFYRAGRKADDAAFDARRAENAASDARRAADEAKIVVVRAEKVETDVQKIASNMIVEFEDVKNYKKETIKSLRAELKASELRELKYLQMIRELEKKLLIIQTIVNSANINGESLCSFNTTQTEQLPSSGPVMEKVSSINSYSKYAS